jgi:membrane fusion protein, multidrug efflux system
VRTLPRPARWTALALALSCLTAACGGEASGRPSARPNSRGGRTGGERPSPVEIATVTRGSIARTTTISGVLEPLRSVGVNAQLSGTLLTVRVEEGSRVDSGAVLAEIDARELEAQVRSAEATLTFAQSTATRSEDLFRQQIMTAAEFERDRAALAAARASLEQLKTRLGYARITAPTTGIITEKRIEAGDVVSAQTRLFAIAEVSTLVTRVQVSELEVRSLTTGAPVTLTVDALPGEHVTGRIRRVFPAADSATRLVPVEVALSGRELARLRPGYTVRATFRLDTRNDALMIPSRAVSGAAGARSVFIVRDGKTERRTVRVGQDVDGRMEVLEGLAFGDTVVVSGTTMLREGAPVRIVPPLGSDTLSGPRRSVAADSGKHEP